MDKSFNLSLTIGDPKGRRTHAWDMPLEHSHTQSEVLDAFLHPGSTAKEHFGQPHHLTAAEHVPCFEDGTQVGNPPLATLSTSASLTAVILHQLLSPYAEGFPIMSVKRSEALKWKVSYKYSYALILPLKVLTWLYSPLGFLPGIAHVCKSTTLLQLHSNNPLIPAIF